jgi:hypothetical protein
MQGIPTHKQEFVSRHRDTRGCYQTHAFLPAWTSLTSHLLMF